MEFCCLLICRPCKSNGTASQQKRNQKQACFISNHRQHPFDIHNFAASGRLICLPDELHYFFIFLFQMLDDYIQHGINHVALQPAILAEQATVQVE